MRVVANRKYKENSAVSPLIELLFYLLVQETQKVHAHEKRSLTKARSQNRQIKEIQETVRHVHSKKRQITFVDNSVLTYPLKTRYNILK
jgi:hypothetical protein